MVRRLVIGLLVMVLLLAVGLAWVAWTQTPAGSSNAAIAADAPGTPNPASTPGAVKAEYEAALNEWRALVSKLRELQERYQVASSSEATRLGVEYLQVVAEGRPAVSRMAAAAEKMYALAPNRDKEVIDLLAAKLDDDLQRDNFDDAARVSKLLIKNGFDDKAIYAKAGMAAYAIDDFESAREYLQRAADLGEIDDRGKRNLADVDDSLKHWEKEKAIRAAEAKADDLPRVKLVTNKGDIVVELFENEAPNTTANFISLVEKHFYDGTKFHRVLPGFMAQAGEPPQGKGSGGPGYTIPDESERKDHRLHFRGSLSVATVNGDPNSGGSQFFLTFMPTPPLNGKHTVFGRVIEGIDVLAKLERTESAQGQRARRALPDHIVTATVLRKRDHKYEPKTVPVK